MTRARVHVSPEGNVATADCRKVSGREFFDALFPPKVVRPWEAEEERRFAEAAATGDHKTWGEIVRNHALRCAGVPYCPGCGRMTDLDANGECADCSAMPELRRNGTGGWL